VTQPFEPIPESTQVHVDRLLGAQVGDYRVLERAGEGRLGTIYRAQQLQSGKAVSLQVLRTELLGNDEEAKAANAIKAPGVVPVLSFGQVPDGRRYRVMEPLEGEALDQVVQRKGKLTPKETIQLLDQVAVVLQAAHAWAVVHGNLGASSVYLANGAVKLIDFGLARRKVTTQDDLRALGALGFTLMTGEELREGAAPPPLSATIPEEFDRLLRELIEQRHADATSARRELAQVGLLLDSPGAAPAPAAPVKTPPAKGSRAPLFAMLGLLLVGGGAGAAFFFWPTEPEFDSNSVSTPSIAEEDDELDEPEAAEQPPEQPAPDSPEPKPRPRITKTPKPVPSAEELYTLMSQLESRLRKQPLRYGDDPDAALFVLNKQRLRLSGSPTLEERKDVAKQLAGWKRSYLRKK
jgi:serine/threonine protein kinase